MRVFVFSLFLSTALCSQVVDHVSTYAGSDNIGLDAVKEHGGKIYHAGTISYGTPQVYVNATNLSGQILWQSFYPQPSRQENVMDMDADSSGLYIVGRSNDSTSLYWDGMVMHLDYYGNVLWRMLTGSGIYGVQCLNDGSIVTVGGGNCMRISSAGTVLWSRSETLPGPIYFNYSDVVMDADTDFYCIGTGYTASGMPSGIITKSDVAGNIIWTKKYQSSLPVFFENVVINDTMLFVTGTVMWPSSSGNFNTYLVASIDSNGAFNSARTTDAVNNVHSDPMGIELTPANTLIVASSYSSSSISGLLITEIDCSSLLPIRSIIQTGTGGFGGIDLDDSNNVWFCSYNGSIPPMMGGMENTWSAGCGFTSLTFYSPTVNLSVSNISAMNATIPSITITTGADSAYTQSWNICTNPMSIQEPVTAAIHLFPNPVTSTAIVTFDVPATEPELISVIDANGKIIDQQTLTPGQQQIAISAGGWCSGIYFLVRADGSRVSFEVISQ